MKRLLVLSLGLLCLLVIAGIAFVWAWPSIAGIATVTDSEIKQFKQTGQTIVNQIEAFRKRQGRLPKSLTEAGIAPRMTDYGPWNYEQLPDGQYYLSVGDYAKHYFTLVWNSEKQEWYLDT